MNRIPVVIGTHAFCPGNGTIYKCDSIHTWCDSCEFERTDDVDLAIGKTVYSTHIIRARVLFRVALWANKLSLWLEQRAMRYHH